MYAKSANMNARCSHFCRVAEVVTLIPHSNAAEESFHLCQKIRLSTDQC